MARIFGRKPVRRSVAYRTVSSRKGARKISTDLKKSKKYSSYIMQDRETKKFKVYRRKID